DLHDVAFPFDPRIDAGFAQLPLGQVLRRIFGASVCARLGATARVATELAGFGLDEYLAVGRSSSGVGVLADIYAIAGTPAQQRNLRDRLAAFGERVVVFGTTAMAFGGPIERGLGLLDAALGDRASAVARLRAALERMRAHGFQTWAVQLLIEL